MSSGNSLTFQNNLKHQVYTNLVEIEDAVVSHIILNGGGSSKTHTFPTFATGTTTPIVIPSDWSNPLLVSFVLGAPRQQSHAMNDVQVGLGATVKFFYQQRANNPYCIDYYYQINQAPPYLIGLAVQAASK